ncbi:hypothetical protein NMG60_11034337 [Bertholletia excelsa]
MIGHRLLLDAQNATAPPPRASSYAADSNFDSNMVIILAVLLCSLLGALGLNSIVRCAWRCGRRAGLDSPNRGSAGLKKDDMARIPIVAYKVGLPENQATECPICLGEFVEGEKVRVLPGCKHEFHVKCIDRWLVSHSSCPTCRKLLPEASSSSNARC